MNDAVKEFVHGVAPPYYQADIFLINNNLYKNITVPIYSVEVSSGIVQYNEMVNNIYCETERISKKSLINQVDTSVTFPLNNNTDFLRIYCFQSVIVPKDAIKLTVSWSNINIISQLYKDLLIRDDMVKISCRYQSDFIRQVLFIPENI